MQVKPMSLEEAKENLEFEVLARAWSAGNLGSDIPIKECREAIKSSLRALLLHVVESLPDAGDPTLCERHKNPDASCGMCQIKSDSHTAINDCKRVIERMIDEI